MCERCEARVESGEAKSNLAKLNDWLEKTGTPQRLGASETVGGAFVRDVGLPFMAEVPPISMLRDMVVNAYLLGISAGAYIQAHGMNDATAIPAVFTDAFTDETPQSN